jgi:hypothetical protein
MKKHITFLAILSLLAIPSLAFASFPFPNGKYVGTSTCTDGSGGSFSTKATFILSDNTFETIYEDATGETHAVMNANFKSNGFFTLSGSDVVRGQGYCVARLFCHYEATLRVQGEEVTGEDSLFIKDGVLYRMGSASFNGARISCEESFPNYSSQR